MYCESEIGSVSFEMVKPPHSKDGSDALIISAMAGDIHVMIYAKSNIYGNLSLVHMIVLVSIR